MYLDLYLVAPQAKLLHLFTLNDTYSSLMSSNIRITRVCDYCGNEFTAQTTRTRYCSHKCNSRHYKALQKGKKIEVSNQETRQKQNTDIEAVKAKEFLTVSDLAKLLNCSTRTAYNLINRGDLKAVKVSERKTLIKRSEIDKLFA